MTKFTNLINGDSACAILGISRPTLIKYREDFQLSHSKVGRDVFYKKDELISKILVRSPNSRLVVDLNLISNTSVETIKIDPATYDLRQVNLIDGYGMMALFSDIHQQLSKGNEINLILDSQFATRYLCESQFFLMLKRQFPNSIFFSQEPEKLPMTPSEDSFLPLTKFGYKTSEQNAISENVIPILTKQGFSEDIAGYIFWVVGELLDNAHTHASANGQCYLSIHRYEAKRKYLQINVCDLGVGIPANLKTKEEFSKLTNKDALAHSFRSGVTSWGDEHGRGKGLSDILGIAIASESFLRIESGGEGFLMILGEGGKYVEWKQPVSNSSGTRATIIIVDKELRQITREEADRFVKERLETL